VAKHRAGPRSTPITVYARGQGLWPAQEAHRIGKTCSTALWATAVSNAVSWRAALGLGRSDRLEDFRGTGAFKAPGACPRQRAFRPTAQPGMLSVILVAAPNTT